MGELKLVFGLQLWSGRTQKAGRLGSLKSSAATDAQQIGETSQLQASLTSAAYLGKEVLDWVSWTTLCEQKPEE